MPNDVQLLFDPYHRRQIRAMAITGIHGFLDKTLDSGGLPAFLFCGQYLNLPPSYAAQLCSQIIAANLDISWRCILFPGGISPKLIEMLARAGCKEVSIGFESGAEYMLHHMKKQF